MKWIANSELVIVIAIMALGALSMSIVRPMLPLYLDSIEVAPTVLGLMFSVAMLGMVFGESSWGWVADRVGIKLPLGVGTAICGIVILGFVLTQSVPILFVIFLFWGVVRSAIYGPGRGYIGATAPPMKKATYMAIISAILAAARSLGALPGGFVVDTLGYNWVFFISGGVGLVGGVLVLFGLKAARHKTSQPADISASSPGDSSFPAGAAFYRPLALQCVVAALQFLGVGILMTFMPLLAAQEIGASATEVGILFTIGGLVTVVLAIPLGIMADRVGKRTFMILGLLTSAAAGLGIFFAPDFPWLLTFGILQSIGMAMFSPAALGLLSDSVPARRQSTIMGLYGGVCENTGVIAGSALGGFVWTAFGPRSTFLAGAIAAALGAILCLGLVRRKNSVNPGSFSSTDCGVC
jgi:PPP family 3-phenylpropionic acid transporter